MKIIIEKTDLSANSKRNRRLRNGGGFVPFRLAINRPERDEEKCVRFSIRILL